MMMNITESTENYTNGYQRMQTALKLHRKWHDSEGKNGKRFSLAEYLEATPFSIQNLNFNGAFLSGADFSGVCTSRNISFAKANLSYCQFDRFKTRGSIRFSESSVSFANFSNASLRFADFTKVFAIGTSFKASDLERSNFLGANLKNCNFDFASLRFSVFMTKMANCSFGFSFMEGATTKPSAVFKGVEKTPFRQSTLKRNITDLLANGISPEEKAWLLSLL
jgi:uncharacterized protein YjbI with pentapeptide repeats